MKKIIIFILIIACLSGCSYDGWNEITVPQIGSFKIPPDWTCHIDDNKIYLTHKDITEPTIDNVYLAGTILTKEKALPGWKVFDDSTEYVDTLKGEIFSNSAYVGEGIYSTNNENVRRTFFYMYQSMDEKIYMMLMDDSVECETVEKIAKSYKGLVPEDYTSIWEDIYYFFFPKNKT